MNEWQILLVDDEQSILDTSKRILNRISYKNKTLNIHEALNLNRAKEIINSVNEIAVVVLDVMLSPSENGLDLIKYLRKDLKNLTTQIILRTGQPSDIPELDVIRDFDIREYLNKNETDNKRLHMAVFSSLKGYEKESDWEKTVNNEVSIRVDLQKKLSESQKLAAIATLTAGVNHEVGNSLNGMAGALAILKKEIEKLNTGLKVDLSRLELSYEKFERGISRASSIINGLSNSVRKDTETITFFSLVENIEQAKNLILDKIKKSAVNLKLEIDPAIEVKYNPTSLVQIFMNLISNACDALEKTKNPEIVIRGLEHEEKYTVEIEDNGPGIKEKNSEQIFDAMYTSKEAGRGTGLGLYMVKDLVNSLGGEIYLDSSYKKGAKFCLVLPCFKRFETLDKAQKNDLQSNKNNTQIKPKIILIDDNEEISSTFKMVYENQFEVITFADPMKALSEINKIKPCLIITDVIFPKINAKFSENLVNNFPDLNVLVQSGHTYRYITEEMGLKIPLEKFHWKTSGVIDPEKYMKPWVGANSDYLDEFKKCSSDNEVKNEINVNNSQNLNSELSIEPIVFVFDDEKDNLDTFLELAPPDWRVFCFDDSTEGITKIPTFKPHLVITDQKMPNTSGAMLVSLCHKSNAPLEVFVVSAFDREEIINSYLKEGFYSAEGITHNFIKKPITSAAIDLIKEKLAKYSKQQLAKHTNYYHLKKERKGMLDIQCYATNQISVDKMKLVEPYVLRFFKRIRSILKKIWFT